MAWKWNDLLLRRLLSRTLRYAAEHVPFYRRFPHLRQEGRALALEDFPLIDRELVASKLQEFLVLDRFPDYLITSGGTTGESPAMTFRNQDEYQVVHRYLAGCRSDELPDLDSIKRFVIDIFTNSNGYYWRKPRGWPSISVTLEQPGHAEVIKQLIRDGLVVAGRVIPARHILSQNGPLRVLTGYFWAQGFSPRDYGLLSVFGYGSYISSVWRERLREFWGAEIRTGYGLSEFATSNALQCRSCCGYHFRSVWPEFLALDMSGPVTEGDAHLVLTSLLPFTRVQPRIRYVTGDIVTLVGRCELTEQVSFRFRGRATGSVVVRQDEAHHVLLSEVEVIEVLDRLPDIACREHFSELQLWARDGLSRPPFRMGFPKFRIDPPPIEDGPKQIGISIEVCFDPATERARADRLIERFQDVLYIEFPSLASQLSACESSLVVELLPRGGLNTPTKWSA
jgi:phenylacetate-coenzyme A ligase PaaK-like adenylate-forming protein